jgi:hypothetical protein
MDNVRKIYTIQFLNFVCLSFSAFHSGSDSYNFVIKGHLEQPLLNLACQEVPVLSFLHKVKKITLLSVV